MEGLQVNFQLNSSLLNKPSDTLLSEIERSWTCLQDRKNIVAYHFYAEQRPLMPKEQIETSKIRLSDAVIMDQLWNIKYSSIEQMLEEFSMNWMLH